MISVQIVVVGLGILCLNNRQGEIGVVDDGEHQLKIEIKETDIDGNKGETIWPTNGNALPTGEISFGTTNSRIRGVGKDEHPIDRCNGTTKADKQSLKWLIDFESTEFHGVPMMKKSSGYPMRKITIPNAYFYTSDVKEQQSYLIRDPEGNVNRFGFVGHKLGAMLYADKVTITVDGDVLSPLKDGKHYIVIISNLEQPTPAISDFKTYYEVIKSPSGGEFEFLLPPRSAPPDKKRDDLEPGADPGVHYECWFCYCSQTDSIDDLM